MEFELIEVLEPDGMEEVDGPERLLRRDRPDSLLSLRDDLIAAWALDLPEQEYG